MKNLSSPKEDSLQAEVEKRIRDKENSHPFVNPPADNKQELATIENKERLVELEERLEHVKREGMPIAQRRLSLEKGTGRYEETY